MISVRPFVAARKSFWAIFQQPLAPVMLGLFVLGGETGLGFMVVELAPGVGLRLVRGQPLVGPWAAALGAFSLAWAGLFFIILGLALSAVQKTKASPWQPFGALGVAGWLTGLGTGLATTCFGLALGLMFARALTHGASLLGAAWGALSGTPSLLFLGLSLLAGLLAAARMTGEGRAPASLGEGIEIWGRAVTDLLASPLDTAAVAGVFVLCTSPLLLLSLLTGLAALWTEIAAARVALLWIHGACLGLALLWTAAGLHAALDGEGRAPRVPDPARR